MKNIQPEQLWLMCQDFLRWHRNHCSLLLSATWTTKNMEGHLCIYVSNGNFLWFVKL